MHLLCVIKTQMVLRFSRTLINVLRLLKYLFIFSVPYLLRVLLNDDFEMTFQSTCTALGNTSVQYRLGFCNNCLHTVVLISMNEDQKLKCPENEECGGDISLSDLRRCSANGRGKGKDWVDFLLT